MSLLCTYYFSHEFNDLVIDFFHVKICWHRDMYAVFEMAHLPEARDKKNCRRTSKHFDSSARTGKSCFPSSLTSFVTKYDDVVWTSF